LVLGRQYRRSPGGVPFVLAALPLALLVLVVPIPVAAFRSIRDFQAMSRTGHAGAGESARLALGIAWPLCLGGAGFLLSLLVGVVTQGLTRGEPAETSPPADGGRPWGTPIVVVSIVLVVPIAILCYLTRGIAPWILQAGIELTRPNPRPTVAGVPLAQVSAMLSNRLILGSVGGLALSLMAALSAVLNVVASGASRTSPALERFTRAVLVILGIAGVGYVVSLVTIMISAMRVIG
jgi:hypothetical protein